MDKETRMTLRLSVDLYEWLKGNAREKRRSLNSQVTEILDAYRISAESKIEVDPSPHT